MKKSIALLLATVLLLASVISIFAVQAEESTKSVEPDELIATFDVNTGALYVSGSSTVLARIGENKTIEEITGYLLDGAGKDYNYFYVYAVVADANGNYVITEEYETLGRPDGVKSDVEVPENGYLVCISVTDDILTLKNEVNVGDIVVFEGFDPATLSTLQPTENPLAGVAKVSFYTAKEVVEEPKVEPDELISTFDVNTGALYVSGSSTVLARIGEAKTIEEITGYLLDGAGKDYNYFYVYAVVADANGNYVITEEYETLGRPDGIKSDVEVPENGYLVCISVTDDILTLKDEVNVGDIVVFESFDPAILATLQPTENPLAGVAKVSFYTAKEVEDEDEPAVEPTNVALGKDYTIGYGTNNATYSASLTDGVAVDTLTYQPGEWFGFTGSNTQNNVGTVTIDLGEYYEISLASIHTYFGKTGDGVVTPSFLKVEVSTNGTSYKALGEVKYENPEQAPGFTTEWVDIAGTALVGRYVKLSVGVQGAFAFINEIEVYGVPSDYTPREPAGEILVDGELDDTGYDDAVWVENNIWQNKNAPQPADMSGKFAARMDDKYVTIAVQIDNTIAPNILPAYAEKVAGGLTANGAQTSSYTQTGATTFRIWVRTNNEKRYLIDVQYLGEELGWVATRAIFPAGSTLTWDDLLVGAAVKYEDGVLTAEIAILKDQFGIEDSVAMFVSYWDNFTDLVDEAHTEAYQCLHICSENAAVNADGYIVDYSGDTNTAPYVYYTEEEIAVLEIEVPRDPTGDVVIDGVLDDSAYTDKTASPWNSNGILQNKGAPQPELSGKFTARADDEYVSIAVQVNGAIEPNILQSYLDAIANAGKLTANGAQADLYAQTGATTFRIWLRTNNEKRYLIDVQYLGETIGWVATRAIFPAGSTLTWDDLKVIAAVEYADGVLTAEFAFPKEQFGITDDFAMFITYSDNFTDETYTTPTYQCLHLCSVDTEVNEDGYIINYSGDTNTAPYVTFESKYAAVESISFDETMNMATLNYINLGAAVVRAGLALGEEMYTPESWAAFAEALANAETALAGRARAITTQDEIDALAAALLAAYDALELRDADYSAVDAAIAEAEELDETHFTEETWKALQDAIAAVERGLKIDEQEAVDAMAKAIEDAIAALEYVDADYSDVDLLIAVVDKMVEEDYTAETWAALMDAIEAVERGLKINEQDKVDAMAKAIADAIFALEKVEPTPDDSSDESTDSSDESTDSSDESTDSSDEGTDSSDESTGSTSEEASTSSVESPSASSEAPADSSSPETGDSGIVIFAILAVLSLAGAIVAVRVRH